MSVLPVFLASSNRPGTSLEGRIVEILGGRNLEICLNRNRLAFWQRQDASLLTDALRRHCLRFSIDGQQVRLHARRQYQ